MNNIYNEKEELVEELYKVLEIVFKDVNLSIILDNYNNKSIKKHNFVDNGLPIDTFRLIAYDKFANYSTTEIDNIHKCITDFLMDSEEKNIFHLILYMSKCCLNIKDKQPICRYSKLLKWRVTSLKLDPDLFLSVFLVSSDNLSGYKRRTFTWDDTLKTDNVNINKILGQGISENHYHLKGASPYFNISWISLMNDILDRDHSFKKARMDENYLDNKNKSYSFKDMILIANNIRLWLYKCLIYNKIDGLDEIRILDLRCNIINHQDTINMYRYDGLRKKTDYFNLTYDEHFYDGEKRLLYLGMRLTLKSGNSKFKKLFYMYLLIKSKFRSEMIQVNNRDGFQNFQYYNERKSIFLKNKHEKKLLVSESILRSLRNQNLVTLEARIVPHENYNRMINDIVEYDKSIINVLSKEKTCWPMEHQYIDINKNVYMKNYNELRKRMCYILHYPKIKDKKILKIERNLKPRGYTMRDNLKKQAINLTIMRENHCSSERVLGIDGCGNELCCRPEVFGQAFRYLKNHFSVNDNIKYELPSLRITYHVGEDFLDISDGLRAVEETVKFLNLSEGDRLGHAMVLGVDVREWYYKKDYRITISKQNYIDNIAWLVCKIKKMDLRDKYKYIDYLEPKFACLYSEIYGDNINAYDENNSNLTYISVYDYYQSWLLRGDNPQLYDTGIFKENSEIRYWDRCAKNPLCKDKIRQKKNIAKLYYLYNFNNDIRKKGSEMITVKIDNTYIDIVYHIQKLIREYVAIQGIAIECNPSSNFLIGTFKRYDKHPITTFYSGNLFNRTELGKEISVSINTDDQGVFNTYLENEFSLMAISLEKAKNTKGELLYDKPSIYKWIDDIRRMGIMQSFIDKDKY